MLLEDSPSSLLRATLSNFSTQPDRAAVSRINDSLSTLQQSRSLRINDAETALRRLSRQLATVSSLHRDALGGHDSQDHARQIVELDTKKFRVAKQAQELEVESERLENELDRLRRKLEDLEEQGVEGDARVRREREGDDPTVYALSHFWSFSGPFANYVIGCDSGSTGVSELPSNKTRLETTIKQQYQTRRRAMSML